MVVQVSGVMDLNYAYRHGNEINQLVNVPVVINQPPKMGSVFGYDINNILTNASLLLNGYSAINKHATTVIGPGLVAVQGSGTSTTDAAYAILQAGNGDLNGNIAALSASGIFVVSANGALVINQNGGTGPLLIENKGNGTGAGGQLVLSAFNGSGQLEYLFGHDEGWYSRDSLNNQQLIPNSGQVVAIVEYVLRLYGLI